MFPVKRFVVSFALMGTCALPSQAALTTINGPQNGKITYGHVEEATDERGAIAAVLRMIHRQYGSQPHVGRFFAAKGTQSVAAFFGVDRGSGVPLEGMLI